MERWQRELDRLGDLTAPPTTRARVDDGPHGDGMPPSPGRGQRLAAGLVALVVFLIGAALLGAAFRRTPTDPVSPAPVDAAVLTLTAGADDAIAELTYGGRSASPVVDSYCWNQENGAQRCADVAMADPFRADEFLIVPQATPFTLVNEDGAEPVLISVARGNDPYEHGRPTTLDELGRLEPGAHVLTVTANWEGRGEDVTFHFPVYVDITDAAIEDLLTGSSWALAQIDGVTLDIEAPPTAVFSTARLVGFNGCNSYGTEEWRVRDGRLVTGEIVQTLILCSGSLEGRFNSILGGEPVVSFDGAALALVSDDGSMVFDRIDTNQAAIVGSFLDCWTGDVVQVGPEGNAILEPAPPSYFTVNLPWIQPSDELVRIAGAEALDQASRWIVVRDGLVVAEVGYPDLTGSACLSAGA
jgi:heat shock protein HslJ